MTGAYLRVKRDEKYSSIEVEHLTPEERREKLKERDPEEIMRWMDMLCEQIVETETLLAQLEGEGVITRPTIVTGPNSEPTK